MRRAPPVPISSVQKARRRFKTWLLSQQLEEASFLYEQRRFLLDSDQLAWNAVGDNELRYERHLFAIDLLSREDNVDIELLVEDTGGVHTALSLFCRQGRFSPLEEMLISSDLTAPDTFFAIADALKWEAPESWRRRLLELTRLLDERYIDLLAAVFGYRRWPMDELLARASGRISTEIVRAVGRSGSTAGLNRLEQALSFDNNTLRTQAAIALLRLGHTDHLRDVFPIVDPDHFAILPLGLQGRLEVQERLERLAVVSPGKNVLIAIGLLGKPSAVALLIDHLEHKTCADPASWALQLITGANLYEEVFIPDPIHRDDLTAAEQLKFDKGEPVYAPDAVPGETVHRISQNPADWRHWWRDHRDGFQHDTPYRLGTPYSPGTLVTLLADPRSSRLFRSLAYEELVIRYRIDFAFDTDFLVNDQAQLLIEVEKWLDAHRDVARRYTANW